MSKILIDEATVKLALDLVIMHHTDAGYIELRNKTRSALREALAEQPAQQDIDWKDQYEKQKRRADMWVAKYEADIGPLEKAGPVAAQQEPVKASDELLLIEAVLKGYPSSFAQADALRAVKVLLAATPQTAQRKPLTNLEGLKLAYKHHWLTSLTLRDAYILGIRDAEAAHGIKENT